MPVAAKTPKIFVAIDMPAKIEHRISHCILLKLIYANNPYKARKTNNVNCTSIWAIEKPSVIIGALRNIREASNPAL